MAANSSFKSNLLMAGSLVIIAFFSGIAQSTVAFADDYESGYEAGKNQYYGAQPDNDSSADYVHGYQQSQIEKQQQQQQNEDSE